MNHMTIDRHDAPWCQEEHPEKEIEVTVSISLSKTIKVLVKDYEVDEAGDEDGKYLSYNYDNCDLHKAVEEQAVLPHELSKYIKSWLSTYNIEASQHFKDIIQGCDNWVVDDLTIIPE